MSESAFYPLGPGAGGDPFFTPTPRKPLELAVVLKVDGNNPDEGDLYLTPEGHEWLVEPLDRAVAQRLKVRFSFWLGEWFLDLNAGTPYVQRILVKGPSDTVIRSIFGQVIRSTEGVSDLLSLTYGIDAQRTMRLKFKAKLADLSTIDSQQYGPFQIAVNGPLSAGSQSTG